MHRTSRLDAGILHVAFFLQDNMCIYVILYVYIDEYIHKQIAGKDDTLADGY